jgi:hypothetical protein
MLDKVYDMEKQTLKNLKFGMFLISSAEHDCKYERNEAHKLFPNLAQYSFQYDVSSPRAVEQL